ncbi:MAG: hypothetical protein WCF36_18350 [Candidatus Nanopelagicales bacterium]
MSAQETETLAGLAPLVGVTPRTVKRFVSTYRVLKAGSGGVAGDVGGPGDRGGPSSVEVTALLLSIVVGLEDVAPSVFAALRGASGHLGALLDGIDPPSTGAVRELARLREWVTDHNRAADEVALYRDWAPTVARYSFAALPT